MPRDEVAPDRLAARILGCAFRAMNTLGAGLLEKVCEKAPAQGLRKDGLRVSRQHAIKRSYDGVTVGEYTADRLVAGCIVVELKAVQALDRVPVAQCMLPSASMT